MGCSLISHLLIIAIDFSLTSAIWTGSLGIDDDRITHLFIPGLDYYALSSTPNTRVTTYFFHNEN